MSFIEDFDSIKDQFDFEQVNKDKSMVYKDYKLLKNKIILL